MPDLDLEPGDYRERKPKGWRWRLPWSHPEDTKLPLVMLALLIAALAYVFIHRDDVDALWLFVGTVVFAAPAGGMLVLWLRD